MSASDVIQEPMSAGNGGYPPNPRAVGTATPGSTGEGVTGAQAPIMRVAEPAITEEVDRRPHRKIAIVGYTTSREEAPYKDDSWQLWGMNNLHKYPDVDESKFSRWYDLHDASPENLDRDDGVGGDRGHLEWLRAEHPFPIYMMDPFESVLQTPDGEPVPPLAERWQYRNAVTFPKVQILSQFMKYFTNTVSWQIAHAVWEALHDETYVFTDLALYGIDMATGSEYANQRPSVEYFLGLAQGLGVELHIPDSSDLLKSAELYGGEDENSGMRAKVATRLRELHEQKNHIENQLQEGHRILASIEGAIDSFAYIQGVWVPPRAGADGRDAVKVPAGALSPVAKIVAEGDAKDRHAKKGT